MGGPHATYFTEECEGHADWVVRGEGFRNFRLILENKLPFGMHFDEVRMAEGFPIPQRDIVYEQYSHFAKSPIKSIMCSIGCPFNCSYCFASCYNKMYGDLVYICGQLMRLLMRYCGFAIIIRWN